MSGTISPQPMTLQQNVTLKFRNLKVVVKNEIFNIAFYAFFSFDCFTVLDTWPRHL